MKIDLHIERLVLDGFAPGSMDAECVRNALGAELTRLLIATPLTPTQGAALPLLHTAALPANASMHAKSLGSGVARTLYSAIGAQLAPHRAGGYRGD